MHLLKNDLLEIKETNELLLKINFHEKADEFYTQLREEQIKKIDEGHGMRFDLMYKDLL